MKVLVPVKQVAKLDDDFELMDDRPAVDPDFVDRDLNEWDAFSLEAAVVLAGEAGEVVAVTVGGEDADAALRVCLAKGAQRGIRVWEEQLEGGDALAVARVLAAVVERESPDLVLCGVQSSDAVNGATGVALAGFLGLTHVAVVRAVEVDPGGGHVQVERELEGGLVEVLRVPLPALLTIQTGINEPRYATFRAIKQADKEEVPVLSLADLGLDEGAVAAATGSRLRTMEPPDSSGGATMLAGGPQEIAQKITDLIREQVS